MKISRLEILKWVNIGLLSLSLGPLPVLCLLYFRSFMLNSLTITCSNLILNQTILAWEIEITWNNQQPIAPCAIVSADFYNRLCSPLAANWSLLSRSYQCDYRLFLEMILISKISPMVKIIYKPADENPRPRHCVALRQTSIQYAEKFSTGSVFEIQKEHCIWCIWRYYVLVCHFVPLV